MSLSAECVRHLVVSLCSNDAANELTAAVNAGVGGTPAVFSTDTDATHLGFFGVTAVAQAAAITQTYNVAARSNPNVTTTSPSTTLVLTGTGIAAKTASLTLTDAVNTNAGTVATSLDQAQKDIGTAFNTLRVEVAAAVADILAIKKLLNSLIDDHQSYGLVAP